MCKQMIQPPYPKNGVPPPKRECRHRPMLPIAIHDGYCNIHSPVEIARKERDLAEFKERQRENRLVADYLRRSDPEEFRVLLLAAKQKLEERKLPT